MEDNEAALPAVRYFYTRFVIVKAWEKSERRFSPSLCMRRRKSLGVHKHNRSTCWLPQSVMDRVVQQYIENLENRVRTNWAVEEGPLEPPIQYEELNCQQRHIVNIVKEHISKPHREQIKKGQHIIVTGFPGCGKSLLISYLRYLFQLKKLKIPDLIT